MFNNDTIAAIATALSDSGIGIIRVSGENAVSIVNKIFLSKNGKEILMNAKSHTIHYGFIVDKNIVNDNSQEWEKNIIDEVMVMIMRAPKSYTMEDTIEINCHGGVFIIQKILEVVLKNGARLAEPGEFTKRAFLNGRIDLSKAEAIMDIIHSQNEYALKASLSQLKGDLSQKIRKLRDQLIYEIAFIESALDDPEHISLDGYEEKLSGKLLSIKENIRELLLSADNGILIKNGISTVIVGRPNAGKSSFLNSILREDRAIVTDIAGTTRDILQESVRIGEVHLNIVDTAGIRNTNDIIEKIGVDKARECAKRADLIIYVMDSSSPLDENDKEILGLLDGKKVIILLNKSDLSTMVDEDRVRNFIQENNTILEKVVIFKTSVKNKEGIDLFEKELNKLFFHGDIKINTEAMITNTRHKEALEKAFESLKMVEMSIEQHMPEDFFSIDLMSAYSYLGSIIGEEVEDDLVEEIFSKFCMGK